MELKYKIHGEDHTGNQLHFEFSHDQPPKSKKFRKDLAERMRRAGYMVYRVTSIRLANKKLKPILHLFPINRRNDNAEDNS